MDFYEAFAEKAAAGDLDSRSRLQRAKLELCKEYGLDRVPRNSEILARAPQDARCVLEPLLRTKPVRTASGVAVVTVMTEPHPCPHGQCVYCPGGPARGTPQSYTGHEPAAMRAARHGYRASDQTRARLEALKGIGHSTDKVELIIIGGTFTGFPRDRRAAFVKGCLDAMNGHASAGISQAQSANETGPHRCVGITIETKPEAFGPAEVDHAISIGVTKVEFGVQSIHDDVLDLANRGHSVADVVEATRLAKDAGLKVGYHMMPGLPGSDPRRDLTSLRAIIHEKRFRPDFLKVYPTLVMEGTALHEMWLRGSYEAITTDEVVDLLATFKKEVPPWLRIQRIQREIPVGATAAGLDVGNVRELVALRMSSEGSTCRCIRCREAGLNDGAPNRVVPQVERYAASGGGEAFLSYECLDSDILVAYARLRFTEGGALLRELRVLGETVPIGDSANGRWQHRGYGSGLMRLAESMATEAGYDALRVTSGIGVRPYYARMGYRQSGPYMLKDL